MARPDTVILHYTGMPTAQGAIDLLCDSRYEVSSHYLIDEEGAVVQLVPESRRAWHAGVAAWKRFLAHSDIAPSRKRDPGERFPWETLAKAGVGLWVPPAPITGGALFQRGEEGPRVSALQTLLSLYGYGLDITGAYDQWTEIVVAAFQRHFRPERVDGIADESTVETLKALVAALEL